MNSSQTEQLPSTRACPVPVVGVIGGIGSGKSTVARWVAEQHPVLVVDADRLGHQVLRQPAIQASLVATFGSQVLNEQGGIDRGKLAERVFGGDAARQSARQQLESIVHPAIRAAMEQQLSEVDSSSYQAVLLDVALLLEAGWDAVCDAVVCIDTPEAVRTARIRQQRNWSKSEIAAREQSQWPLSEKSRLATHTISNAGAPEEGGNALWRIVAGLRAEPTQ